MPTEQAIRERPIVLKDWEVRAILPGNMTQFRRVVGGCSVKGRGLIAGIAGPDTDHILFDADTDEWYCEGGLWHKRCPFGGVGDMLYVKETWAVDAPLDQVRREYEDVMSVFGHGPYYKADKVHEGAGLTWRSPATMPRWASRITLQNESVRVGRLHDITEEDARAAGIRVSTGHMWRPLGSKEPMQPYTHRQAFAALWDEIWDTNPFCWAITFRRL